MIIEDTYEEKRERMLELCRTEGTDMLRVIGNSNEPFVF
jgi:hypothetical protein